MVTQPCTHRWQIAPATGPRSTGRCKHCGEVREFVNFIEVSGKHFGAYDPEWLSRRSPGHLLEGER